MVSLAVLGVTDAQPLSQISEAFETPLVCTTGSAAPTSRHVPRQYPENKLDAADDDCRDINKGAVPALGKAQSRTTAVQKIIICFGS